MGQGEPSRELESGDPGKQGRRRRAEGSPLAFFDIRAYGADGWGGGGHEETAPPPKQKEETQVRVGVG